MMMTRLPARLAMAAACFAAGVAVTAALAQSSYPPLEVLLSSSQTVLGQDFAYPPGKPVITAAIVTLEPGASTGVHRHEAPLLAMILEGELTVDYGQGVTRHFTAGDTLIEAFQSDHNGTNTGDAPVRILAVFAGSDSVPNTVVAE
jgi:quercetin dioxygenase-like cupin family protein